MENNNNNLPALAENVISTTRFETFKGGDIVRASFGLKVKDLQPGNDEPIKQSLRYIFALIGLRGDNIPTDLQKAVLIDFIRSELGNFTLEDFKIAFVLAVKGEIKAEINHFQNFSSLYLSQVLNAYQNQKNKAIHEFKKEEERRIRKEKEKQGPSEDEIKRIQLDFDRNCVLPIWFDFLKTGSIDFGSVLPYLVYESLHDRHKILKINRSEKIKIHEKATDEIKESLKRSAKSLRENREMKKIDRVLNTPNGKDQVLQRCYSIAVSNFFEELKSKKLDLEKLMNIKTIK